MSRYFRIHVPERHIDRYTVTGGIDLIFDRDHLQFVEVYCDGSAFIRVDGCKEGSLVYKDEADRLIEWMGCEE